MVLTDLVFPSSPDCRVELHSEDADLLLLEGEAASLRTAWPEKRACLPQFTQLLDGSWADVLEGLEGDCGGLGGIFTEEIVEDFSFSKFPCFGLSKRGLLKDRRCVFNA